MVFESHSHQRFEGGIPKLGAQTCNRTVKIEKNTNGCKGYQLTPGDGFIVSILNVDGNHPLWGDNYQMSPKPMKQRPAPPRRCRGLEANLSQNHIDIISTKPLIVLFQLYFVFPAVLAL